MSWKLFYRARSMKEKDGGRISSSLMSIQLQLKTLLEEAGGESALTLLDLLGELNRSEQRLILAVFSRSLKRILTEGMRLRTMEDDCRKAFEDGLYEQIVHALEKEKKAFLAGRFRVLEGGACVCHDEKRAGTIEKESKGTADKEKTLLN